MHFRQFSLTAGGFIDSTVGSENYGEFGVGADKVRNVIMASR